jgi:hypothetical protein
VGVYGVGLKTAMGLAFSCTQLILATHVVIEHSILEIPGCDHVLALALAPTTAKGLLTGNNSLDLESSKLTQIFTINE